MAILDTYGYAPEIAEALDEAFEQAGVSPQVIGTEHIASAMRSIKLMLNSEWSTLGIRQWMVVQATQAITVGMQSFDLPVGAIDIVGAILRRSTADTPMFQMSRDEWRELSTKNINGRPDRYFADRRYNKVTLYLWRRGENTNDVIVYDYFRQISDPGAPANTLQMPAHMLAAFHAGLATRIALKYNAQKYELLQSIYRGPDPKSLGGLLREAINENRDRADTQLTVSYGPPYRR